MTETFADVNLAVNYLHQLPRLHRKNDLTFVKRALAYFGNPQDRMKTIHVTGTNGKGSTSYYLANLLKTAGLKTGLFVSPFVIKFNERIQLNGEYITDFDLVNLINQVKLGVDQLQQQDHEFGLTEFEFLVVMAFLYFSEKKVQYAVIEAGIGARHDKTNVITPEVSLITSVGLDHEELIGPTIKDIAFEKSGIIKQGVPLVLGKIDREPLGVILDQADFLNAPVAQLGTAFHTKLSEKTFDLTIKSGQAFTFLKRPEVETLDVGMAVQAFALLNIVLPKSAVEKTINETNIPGRYQILQEEPMVIVDGAHNIQAMTNLLSFLATLGRDASEVHFIVTMMKDKDLWDVFKLLPKKETTLTTISYPRAAKRTDFEKAGIDFADYEADFTTAFKKVYNQSKKHDIIVITGSYYFVTDFLNFYNDGGE